MESPIPKKKINRVMHDEDAGNGPDERIECLDEGGDQVNVLRPETSFGHAEETAVNIATCAVENFGLEGSSIIFAKPTDPVTTLMSRGFNLRPPNYLKWLKQTNVSNRFTAKQKETA